MARFDWYPVLNICLGSLAALIILVLPLADGLPAGPIASWRDAPAAAFLFPPIGFALAPIYPTIISVMLSAMPERHLSQQQPQASVSATAGVKRTAPSPILLMGGARWRQQ